MVGSNFWDDRWYCMGSIDAGPYPS
uniref:Uncharacterized protein n=1 Tax=Moniliophthora roreri TaxID=221103 RepID=A0A0W0F4P0_MONRR